MLGVAALVRPQALLCAPFLGAASCATRWRPAGGRRGGRPLRASRLVARAAVDRAQLPRDGRLRPRQHQRRVEPRHRRLPSRHRPLRDAARERRLPRRDRPGPAGPLLASLRARRDRSPALALARARAGASSGSPSTTSRSPWSTCTRRAPRPGRRRRERRHARQRRWRTGLLLAAAALGGVAFPLARAREPARCARRRHAGRCSSRSPSRSGSSACRATRRSSGRSPSSPPRCPGCRCPGRPASPPALLLGVALLATTAITHAVFFGEDRYHMVVTPVLALLAAAALRPARADARSLTRPACAVAQVSRTSLAQMPSAHQPVGSTQPRNALLRCAPKGRSECTAIWLSSLRLPPSSPLPARWAVRLHQRASASSTTGGGSTGGVHPRQRSRSRRTWLPVFIARAASLASVCHGQPNNGGEEDLFLGNNDGCVRSRDDRPPGSSECSPRRTPR